ncbi:MAG: energy transducer TonB [Lysobacteraceae bacterium]
MSTPELRQLETCSSIERKGAQYAIESTTPVAHPVKNAIRIICLASVLLATDALRADDQADVIIDIMSPPIYPARAARECVSGDVLLEVTIDESGKVTTLKLLKETPEDYGFGKAAIRGMRIETFDTSEHEPGIPFQMPINFEVGSKTCSNPETDKTDQL